MEQAIKDLSLIVRSLTLSLYGNQLRHKESEDILNSLDKIDEELNKL